MTATTAGTEPPVGETVTVRLIAKAMRDLAAACEREGLSQADVINRAVSLYDFITGQLASGHELVLRETGNRRRAQLVKML